MRTCWQGMEMLERTIRYAKEKGCSMTGPEDPEIEEINILTQERGKWSSGSANFIPPT
mgnify:CR=1 FL=1